MKNFKKLICILLACSLLLSLTCVSNVNANTSNCNLRVKCFRLYKNQKATLKFCDKWSMKITPTIQSCKSNNTKVATVNSKGIITAKGIGQTKIICKAKNKTLTCTVRVLAKNDVGEISGNITYFYNDFKGNVSDTSSEIFLIPMDKSAYNSDSYMITKDKWQALSTLDKSNICHTTVDGKGEYIIQDVPSGKYHIFIISNHTNCKDAYYDNLYNSMADKFSLDNFIYISDTYGLDDLINEQKYYHDIITIKKDRTTIVSHDFGATYKVYN